MPRTNYEHEKDRRRRELLQAHIRALGKGNVATLIGVSPSGMTTKYQKCTFYYEELVKLFKDKSAFTDVEILRIMGRRDD